MFTRIFIVAALVLGLMLAVKDGRLTRAAGLSGSCVVTQAAPDGSDTEACRAGKLEGLPNLSGVGCTNLGAVGKLEYWSCPAEVTASQAGR